MQCTLQNKGTGELSFLTCFMNFAGSIGKIKYMPKLVVNHYILPSGSSSLLILLFYNTIFIIKQYRYLTLCGVHIRKIFSMT